MGPGAGRPGACHRGSASRAAGLCGAAAPLGGGAHLRVAWEVKAIGPRLRTQTRARRGDDQGRHDPADGRAAGRGGLPAPRADRAGSRPPARRARPAGSARPTPIGSFATLTKAREAFALVEQVGWVKAAREVGVARRTLRAAFGRWER